jgi:hypothetical protein
MEKTIRLIAERLVEQEFVEIYAHHDVDGIAAASILCQALRRIGGRFRMRVIADLTPGILQISPQAVFCDLGSSTPGLSAEAVVIDHHVPHFTGIFHLNPRLFGLDGERELSSSGTAYLVAQEMGDNRDLVGLALLGILGDGQAMTGKNREIVHEGIAHQFLTTTPGFLLPGRDMTERLSMAIDPYLDGLSGNEARCRQIIEECTSGGEVDGEALVSRVLLEVSSRGSLRAMQGIFGTRYLLEREAIHDAHTLAALIDACGKAGAGGLGSALCLRHQGVEEEAWKVMTGYRMQVIEAVQSLQTVDEQDPWFEVVHPHLAGSVADALAFDLVQNQPVAVFARSEGAFHVSLRTPEQVSYNLEYLARDIAAQCGGQGGGHESRAGAVIGMDQIECFKNGLRKAMAG